MSYLFSVKIELVSISCFTSKQDFVVSSVIVDSHSLLECYYELKKDLSFYFYCKFCVTIIFFLLLFQSLSGKQINYSRINRLFGNLLLKKIISSQRSARTVPHNIYKNCTYICQYKTCQYKICQYKTQLQFQYKPNNETKPEYYNEPKENIYLPTFVKHYLLLFILF